jgi:hypothetical protein
VPTRKQWVFDPDHGGRKIPEGVAKDVKKRIERVAEQRFNGHYLRLDIRFRNQFCYIDAYRDVDEDEVNRLPQNWPETREQYAERMRNTPVHLCRLRFFDDERWGFAFYTYSHEKYELSVYPNGEFLGQPEDAFLCAANMYLSD